MKKSFTIKIAVAVCVFVFAAIMLAACGAITFKINDITRIELTDGNTGDIVEITDTDVIQELIRPFNENEFKKGESTKNQAGWSYRLNFYQNDKLSTSIVIHGQDGNRISFNDFFYDTADSCIDTEYYRELLNKPEPQSPNALVPSIMIEGTLYLMSQKEKPGIEIADSDYLGVIKSTVPLSEWPTENGQANIDVEGAPYAEYETGIVVLWNGEWTLFLTEQEYLSEE